MKIIEKSIFVSSVLKFLMKKFWNKLSGRKNLVVTIRAFSSYGYSEAVNKQGLDFCRRLEKEKINFICVSLDDRLELMKDKNIDVLCVRKKQFSSLVRTLSPDSIVFFNSCLVDLFPYEEIYSHYCSLFILTSNKPTIDVEKHSFALVNMIHLHDYGRLSLLCHSEKAQTNLIECGFVSAHHELPFIAISSINMTLKAPETLKFVGFASSPLQRKDYISKGCEYFFNEAKNCSEFLFEVSWRDEKIPVCVAVPENVNLAFGKIDMSKFYEKIDCVVLPYVGELNHAFPLSCLEAILSSIPVAVSNRCGCSEYIERHGIGVVFDVQSESLCHALKGLSTRYTDCITTLQGLNNKILEDIERSYGKMMSMVNDFNVDSNKVDLRKWKKELEENNKELVIGTENLSNYYKNEQVAKNYDEERFTLSPQGILSAQEVDFVSQVCSKLDSRKVLLDLACGTGRFHPVYEFFEKVVMLDSSAEMRQVCQGSSWFNSESTVFHTSDLLAFEPDIRFDAIICFRLLRHFQMYERKRFLEKITKLLRPQGVLVFDVPLLQPELSIRESEGWNNYNVYDYFWNMNTLEREMSSLGFSIYDFEYLGREMISSSKHKQDYFEMCCAIHKK